MGQLASWSGEMVGGCRRAESLLAPGNTAPVFCLPDADMGIFDLSEALQRKTVVLHFYPRDVMPSSLKQAIDERFGAEARFHTCSASEMDADALIDFLARRGKFIDSESGFQTRADKICNHG